MNIKKVIQFGWRNRGNVLISSWKCNFTIYSEIQVYYLDIQAITTLLCLLLVLDVLVPSIDSFFSKAIALWKVTCPITSKSTPPTVFNLHAPDWVHYEEETCAYAQLTFNTYKLVNVLLQIFKVVYFGQKKYTHFENSIKFIILFFSSKKVNWACVYMYWIQWFFQIFDISKILWGVGFCLSATKRRFIFYNSFSLLLKENLHEQKHFLKIWSTCFVYIILL